MTAPAVKVCGLMRHGDAVLAVDAGAAYLGAILAPGYRRTVTPEAARVIFGDLPARKVGVFVNAPWHDLISVTTSVAVEVVQLHGDEPPEYVERVAEAGFEVWKAVRPRDADDFAAAVERYGHVAHALLLDGFSAAAAGGTGTRFPWEAVAARLDLLPPGVRLVAAGGMTPENVAEAARILRPHVVDVSSGVERETGVKDAEKVRAFAAAVRSVDGATASG